MPERTVGRQNVGPAESISAILAQLKLTLMV